MSLTKYCAEATPLRGRGNPLCEALPVLPSGPELEKRLTCSPFADFASAAQGPAAVHEISALLHFNLPRLESPLLATRCMSMIYNAYVHQCPFDSTTRRRLHSINAESFSQQMTTGVQSDATLVLGWSGMGKSTLINSVLKLIPQVIDHVSYGGRDFIQRQIVWLSVDGPNSGSPKGFLLNIARKLDEALGLSGPNCYLQRLSTRANSVDSLRVLVASALATHHVGLLHVDDVQRFSEGNSEIRRQAGATLIGLANICKCSLLFSGTPPALEVIQANFETTRRVLRRGSIQLAAATSIRDEFFKGLVDFLFKFQLPGNQLIISDSVREQLLRLTAGVPAILTSLYVCTLEYVALSGRALSAELFDIVWRQQFAPLVPAVLSLNKLRASPHQGWDERLDRDVSEFLSGRRGQA